MNYATIKEYDIANGLGVRVSIFVSGCTHHCKGCFNEVAWPFEYGELFTKETEDYVMELCGKSYIQGLSLLGGEPFEIVNQRGLIEVLRRFKKEYPNKNIWCYSGYLFDSEILHGRAHCEVTDEMLSYIDILVDGRFIEEQKDISLQHRGSYNQRVIDVKKSLAENKVIIIDELMK